MVPRTSRELLTAVRPVVGVMIGWAVVVLFSEFGIKNIGYHRPFSLIWWIGMLVTIVATMIAIAAVLVFILSQGIALGTEGDNGDSRSAERASTDD